MDGVLFQPSCFVVRVVDGNLVVLVVADVERSFVGKELHATVTGNWKKVHWCKCGWVCTGCVNKTHVSGTVPSM